MIKEKKENKKIINSAKKKIKIEIFGKEKQEINVRLENYVKVKKFWEEKGKNLQNETANITPTVKRKHSPPQDVKKKILSNIKTNFEDEQMKRVGPPLPGPPSPHHCKPDLKKHFHQNSQNF